MSCVDISQAATLGYPRSPPPLVAPPAVPCYTLWGSCSGLCPFDALEQILHRPYSGAYLHVNVAVVLETKRLVVRHDVRVRDDTRAARGVCKLVLPLAVVWRAAPVLGIHVVRRPRCRFAEVEWKPVFAQAVLAYALRGRARGCGMVAQYYARVRL